MAELVLDANIWLITKKHSAMSLAPNAKRRPDSEEMA